MQFKTFFSATLFTKISKQQIKMKSGMFLIVEECVQIIT